MNELHRAIYRAITGRYVPETEPRTVSGMVDAIARRYGTTPPEGVSSRSWRRYRSDVAAGREPRVSPRIFGVLRGMQRRVRLSAAREAKLRRRRPRPFVGVAGDIQVSSDRRRRKLVVSGWPDPPEGMGLPPITGMLGPVIDAWLAGDDEAAAAALLGPMAVHLGQTPQIHELSALAFGDRPTWWDSFEP